MSIKKLKIVLKERRLIGSNQPVSKFETVVRNIEDFSAVESYRMISAVAKFGDFVELYRGLVRVALRLNSQNGLEIIAQSCANLPRTVKVFSYVIIRVEINPSVPVLPRW